MVASKLTESASTAKQGNDQPKQAQQQQPKATSTNVAQPRDDIDNKIHYEMNPRFAHIKTDATHHDLSYPVKREPYDKQLRWGNTAYLIVGAVALILVSLAIFGITFYRRHSYRAYRSQGFFEVGQTANIEEKNVTNMQINAYENPTYKYYEAQA